MEIKNQVESLAREILESNKQEVAFLCSELNVSVKEIVNAWITWDTGINEYDNKIYSSNSMRCAMHLHNYIANNWHDKRQQKVLEWLNKIQSKDITDVGFGTPQRYVTEYVLKNKVRLSLLDFDEESLNFAKIFLNSKSQDWNTYITLEKYDMNKDILKNNFDTYIFQDSIEHTNYPTEYLHSVVRNAESGSKFILCIPVEIDKCVPEHNILMESKEMALAWVVKSGLKIVEFNEIEMNPNLDIFAKFLHPDFRELLVLAEK